MKVLRKLEKKLHKLYFPVLPKGFNEIQEVKIAAAAKVLSSQEIKRN
jgi:hypothetical protein